MPDSKHQPCDNPQQAKILYPCTWVYKVIGKDHHLLRDIILSACSPYKVKINHSHSSAKGKYHSFNAELEVPSEKIRLKIYKTLIDHPVVKIVL